MVLLTLAVPVARITLDRGLQRRFAAFPRVRIMIALIVPVYCTAVITLALLVPEALRMLILVAAIAAGYHAWQARSSFGISKRLPPGSLSLLPSGPWRDPQYYKKKGDRWGPVFKFRHFAEPGVAIVGLTRIAEFLKSGGDSLVVPPAPFNAIVPGGFVRYLDGPRHSLMASALRSAFTTRAIGSSQEHFRQYARLAVEAIGSGMPVATGIDRYVFSSLLASFLGVEDGARLRRLERLFIEADYRRLGTSGEDRARAAVDEIIADMRQIAREGVERPTFLSELAAAHPDAVESDEILGNLAYALHTGRVDATSLLIWVVAMLGDHPDVTRAVRCRLEHAPGDTTDLADRIVRETLRLRQSEFLLRRTTGPVDFDGYVIPAGWHVRLCIAESHRLADVFENPENFEPDRFLAALGRTRYAPFGFSPHRCPGDHLARALGQHLVCELAREHDVVVRDVEPWEFSGFHWRPNSRMQVRLQQAKR